MERDYDEAVKWARLSADQGDPDGLYMLASCYLGGYGVKKGVLNAIQLFKEAAEKGHLGAKEALKELEQ